MIEENKLENHEKEKLTINIVKANTYGLLFFVPVIAVFAIPYYVIWNSFDGYVMINLLKNENGNDLVQDHPSEAGCFIFRSRIS